MLVSIITVVKNRKKYIGDTIVSVLNQSYYPNIEYIVIDRGSMDGTANICRKYSDYISKFLSEPDKGIYDALNKGIDMASGDLIGFLFPDNLFADDKAVEKIVTMFNKYPLQAVYSDLHYVSADSREKVIRKWKGGSFNRFSFLHGWSPPYSTLFVLSNIYEKYGTFNSSYKFSADYDLILRFMRKHKIAAGYVEEVLFKKIAGTDKKGFFTDIVAKSREDYAALKANGYHFPFYTLFFKNLRKLPQFIT